MNRSSISGSGKAKYKIVFLGDQNTGKTSIIERFINDRFNPESVPTIGIDFLGRNVSYNSRYYRLQLWDTAGQERYKSLIPSYLKDAICAVYVFDLANTQSLDNIERWIQMFKQNKGPYTVSALCGNKLDLCSYVDINGRDFDKSRVELLLQQNKMPFYQVSACTGQGIQNMFFGIIDQINQLNDNRNKLIRQQNQAQQTIIHQNQQTVTETLGYEAPPSTRVAMRLNDNDEEPLNPQAPKKKGCCF